MSPCLHLAQEAIRRDRGLDFTPSRPGVVTDYDSWLVHLASAQLTLYLTRDWEEWR